MSEPNISLKITSGPRAPLPAPHTCSSSSEVLQQQHKGEQETRAAPGGDFVSLHKGEQSSAPVSGSRWPAPVASPSHLVSQPLRYQRS